jgi:hypothetical protein
MVLVLNVLIIVENVVLLTLLHVFTVGKGIKKLVITVYLITDQNAWLLKKVITTRSVRFVCLDIL